jgi:riboflavin biosynthesis pyrimidine reductase
MPALDGAGGGHLPLLPAGLGRGLLHLLVARSIVITVAQAPAPALARAAEVAEVAEVIVAGERDVDLATALDALGVRGFRMVLAEGGPTLNGQLAAAGLLEVLCLTVPQPGGRRRQADPR